MKQAFTAVIGLRGVNPFVRVGARRAQALKQGWRKPLPVRVRVDGKPDEGCGTNLMPVGDGSFFLYLHGGLRKASSTAVGDRVRVEIELDASYRNGPQHPLPPSFQRALRQNPIASRHWVALSPSRQKEILRYFARLRSKAALDRNVDRALQVLAGSGGRFMGRLWKDGS